MKSFDFQTHKKILVKILKDIYTDNSIGPVLGFKGGTAALLFYDLPRHSVDLDFDLTDSEHEEHVFNKVETILLKYGNIKQKAKKKHTLYFELSYEEGAKKIKVEISTRNFGSSYEILNYYGISMKVMIKADMFANKMAALYERMEKTSRDIFDVWYFYDNNWLINKELLEKRMSLTYIELLADILKRLEKISKNSMISGLGELLETDKDKFWVKERLKPELTFFLKVELGESS
jgi:predicted nucleotidyltransferase component of viral defense system